MTTFYRLESDEWLELTKALSYTEARILFYIRTLDPFSTKALDVSSRFLAEKFELGRSTINAAISKLREKGLIEWREGASITGAVKSKEESPEPPTEPEPPTAKIEPAVYRAPKPIIKQTCQKTSSDPIKLVEQALEPLQRNESISLRSKDLNNLDRKGLLSSLKMEWIPIETALNLFEIKPSDIGVISQALKDVNSTMYAKRRDQYMQESQLEIVVRQGVPLLFVQNQKIEVLVE